MVGRFCLPAGRGSAQAPRYTREPMKIRVKLFITIFLSFSLLYAAAYFFMVFKGRAMIIGELERLTKKKVTIGYFDFTPLFSIEIKNLNMEGMFSAGSISAFPSIPHLLFGNIAFNSVKVIAPHMTIERNAPVAAQSLPQAGTTDKVAAQTSVKDQPKPRSPFYLICRRLIIQNGTVDFIDHTIGEQGIRILVKDIDVNVYDLYTFPFSGSTNFELKCRIPWQKDKEEGKIFAEGWFNLFRKDIQANLSITDIDGVYLHPYYKTWVDLEKSRIESVKLSFFSDIRGLNNNVTAQCRLELNKIVRKPLAEGEGEENAAKITNVLLDIFRALDHGEPSLKFFVHTKFDNPEFRFDNIKTAFEDKVQLAHNTKRSAVKDIVALPSQLIKIASQNIFDLAKSAIGGTIAVGRELKKIIKSTTDPEKH